MRITDFEEMRARLSQLGFTYTETAVEELRGGATRMRCEAVAGDGTTYVAYWFKGNESADTPRLTVLCGAQAHALAPLERELRDAQHRLALIATVALGQGDAAKLRELVDEACAPPQPVADMDLDEVCSPEESRRRQAAARQYLDEVSEPKLPPTCAKCSRILKAADDYRCRSCEPGEVPPMSSDPKHIAEIRARVDALKAGDTVTAEDARELLSWIEVERRRAKYSEEQVVVGVRMSPLTYRYLASLRLYGHKHVGDVLAHLANCAADGIRRPGSWERPWVVQAFGDVPEGGPDASGYGVKPYEPGRDED